MKKVIALLTVFALMLVMTSCSFSSQAFEISKEAFNNINEAYEKTNLFSKDIYTAWNIGINQEYASLDDLAEELSIPKSDLEKAVAKLLGKDSYAGSDDWYTLRDTYYSDSFFSAFVDVVSTAYEVNGTADEIKNNLEEAKQQMKKLSDRYSDYEHYPNLKEYFTNTTAFFGFCLDPEGSFEQVVTTFNDYRNNARNYYYDLNYVFEDSLFDKDEKDKFGFVE